MEMRCVSYLAQVKSSLLVQAILDMHATKEHVATSNLEFRRLDRVKTQFIASMTHELSNPLTNIINYSYLLAEGSAGGLTARQSEYLKVIVDSAGHLKDLVADAMDISRIEAGALPTRVTEFELDDAIVHALALVEQGAEEKGLTVRIEGPHDIRLRSDRRRLIQCVSNLLSNAIKYSARGEITLSASREPGDIVRIDVRDCGLGIPEEELELLFEPFERGQSARESPEGGSGIGLFLTKKLITTVLGGEVTVETAVGEGSTFTLRLPRTLV